MKTAIELDFLETIVKVVLGGLRSYSELVARVKYFLNYGSTLRVSNLRVATLIHIGGLFYLTTYLTENWKN